MAKRIIDSLKTRAFLREALIANGTIIVECLDEDLQIDGNASAIDDATDREIADEIRKQLADGNQWAWCTVRVTVKWRDYEASDILGACSYESREAFLACDYYTDMVHTCAVDLVAQLFNAREALDALAARTEHVK